MNDILRGRGHFYYGLLLCRNFEINNGRLNTWPCLYFYQYFWGIRILNSMESPLVRVSL